jgi:hypothetical protein
MLVKQKLKLVSCLGGPRRSERTAMIALQNEFDRAKCQEQHILTARRAMATNRTIALLFHQKKFANDLKAYSSNAIE